MATIVRIKRRRDEDPLEILLLANKKPKNDIPNEAVFIDPGDKSSFMFAGTVSSKDDGISRHVKEAIRKEKLEREYKQHQANILGSVRQRSRQHKHQKSQQNRFKVISKHRALDLDRLDASKKDVNNKDRKQTVCQKCGLEIKSKGETNVDKSIVSNKIVSHETISENVQLNVKEDTCESKTSHTGDGTSLTCSCNGNEIKNCSEEQERTLEKALGDTGCVRDCEKTKTSEKVSNSDKGENDGDGMFCLVDMESERGNHTNQMGSSTADQITCNSEPMAREVVSERPNDDDYVYDIYYTNSRQFDFRMFERDLTFEAYNGGLMFDREFADYDDNLVYEDDEDEEAENNFRKIFPRGTPKSGNETF
ncbi:probable RNA polymerase II nuclear localization protein SLC7A6OS [Ruditapes philippinarum]|uniref:probable RNA polymerase II nuclear localization protein SLC7A6OS n=1 Tax=Ruditapes philippinarum TaxID=129788 RepID=UPI00295BFEA7|nr:probable RNA polymerase II nuclear localization protein SLC7A6OS [Ruditapes philippinarum]